MKKKDVKIIIWVVVALVILGGVYFLTRKTYSIEMPQLSDIVSMNYTQGSKSQLIGDSSIISNIYYTLKKVGKTSIKSENNVSNYSASQIILYTEDSIGAILFLYEKDNKYYIEQPNNGIYEITKEISEKIQNYIN